MKSERALSIIKAVRMVDATIIKAEQRELPTLLEYKVELLLEYIKEIGGKHV